MKAGWNVFPYDYGSATVYTGLTARDYIAIQAMTGLLAGISVSHGSASMPSYESIATDCYKMADAMIERSEAHE